VVFRFKTTPARNEERPSCPATKPIRIPRAGWTRASAFTRRDAVDEAEPEEERARSRRDASDRWFWASSARRLGGGGGLLLGNAHHPPPAAVQPPRRTRPKPPISSFLAGVVLNRDDLGREGYDSARFYQEGCSRRGLGNAHHPPPAAVQPPRRTRPKPPIARVPPRPRSRLEPRRLGA
jgi:hypothetical protein